MEMTDCVAMEETGELEDVAPLPSIPTGRANSESTVPIHRFVTGVKLVNAWA